MHMALVGVSIVVVSITYLLYLRQWPWAGLAARFRRWNQQAIAQGDAATEKHDDMDDADTQTTTPNGSIHQPPPSASPPPAISLEAPTTTTTAQPPPRPASKDTALMPPPPRPPPKPLTTAPAPPRGPIPNRTPTQRTNHLTPLSASTLPAAKSRKVLLAPGHSPLDWAALTRSSANLAGVPSLQRVTRAQLAQQTGRKGRPAWAAWRGRVYNVGPYLAFHPGGAAELMRAAGAAPETVARLFGEVHPWVNWEGMLGACVVGVLVEEGEGLEALD